jgi:exonuclease 3'-5' domain-containing protein 1
MYVNLEGLNLYYYRSISILTLLVVTNILNSYIYLINVYTLGADVFRTPSTKGKTLKDILQDKQILKIFFNVRNDSDALYAHFNVSLQGIKDVQLMESAMRKTSQSRRLLSGLKACVENNVTSIDRSGQTSWKVAKENGEQLFKAERGGSYEILNQRPIPEDSVAYCVGDVQHLPELRDKFWTNRTSRWRELVREESMKRVLTSQGPEYQPHGSHKALFSWSQEHNTVLNEWGSLQDDDWDWQDDATSWRDCVDDCDAVYSSN